MSQYVDGFLLPVPAKNLATHRKMAKLACKVWREHGAIDYRESIGDDLKVEKMAAFPKVARAKDGETVVFACITYKSKPHRDKVNAKAMKDPRLVKLMQAAEMPFDCKRMAYGGFKTIVR